jgi:hypothetical protein
MHFRQYAYGKTVFSSTPNSHYLHIKDLYPDCMSRHPAYVPTPVDPISETGLVRAFCTPVEELWNYVQKPGGPPMGWQGTEVVPRVREARNLIVAVKGYLDAKRDRPTTEEVRAILSKLEEVANASAKVSNHRNTSTLTIKLMACGPPCQAYVAYIDPDQSHDLPWQNGLTEIRKGNMHTADVQTLLHRMKKINI